MEMIEKSKFLLMDFSEILQFISINGIGICYKKIRRSYLFPSASGFDINYNKPIPSCRVHQIMKKTTDYFPHWCSAVYENIYGQIIFDNNPYKLAECMGLKRLDSTKPYIQSDFIKDLVKLYLL